MAGVAILLLSGLDRHLPLPPIFFSSPVFCGEDRRNQRVSWCWLLQDCRLIGVTPKIVIRLEFCGEPEGGEHFAGLVGVDLAGEDTVEDHGERQLDGAGVAQRMKHVGAEARPRADGGGVGAAEFLVEVAEGTGGEGRRLAAAAVGFGMAAESVFGTDHEGPFCSEGGWRGIPQGLKPLTLLVEVAEAQGDPMLKHGATSLGYLEAEAMTIRWN